jgi:hypothetical protein
MRRVATADLIAADIPTVGETWVALERGLMYGPNDDWSLHSFALSFDGYEFLAGANAQYLEMTDIAQRIYEVQPNILKCFTITGLRCLLFIEQRKVKDTYPGRTTRYVRDIVESIRARLST